METNNLFNCIKHTTKNYAIFIKACFCSIVLTGVSFTAICQQASNADNDHDFKKISFGFNIGYLSTLKNKEFFEKPLSRIKADGFTDLRIYEPFTNNLYKNPELQYELLKSVTDKGFNVLLCLSDYPHDEAPANAENSDDDDIRKTIKFSNRFAPTDISAYTAFLNQFVEGLKENDILEKMSFEIGNEPDAKKYFWSTPADFIKIAKASKVVLLRYNRPIYCCGFTTGLSNNYKTDVGEYSHFLKDDNFFKDVDLSFHIYPNNKYEIKDIYLPHIDNSIVTEFNLFSYQKNKNDSKNDYFNSPNLGAYIVELLSYAYENNIKAVYFFTLIDSPQKEGTLGFFDAEGNPKVSYEYLTKIYSVIKDGYKVEKTADYISVIGRKKSILYLTKNNISFPNELNGRSLGAHPEILTTGKKDFGELKTKGKWEILDNN